MYLEKPERNKRLIEQRIDPDDAIFFLDRPEDEIFFRTLFPPPSPHHFVAAQPATKIALVQLIENRAQIEISSLMLRDSVAAASAISDERFFVSFSSPWSIEPVLKLSGAHHSSYRLTLRTREGDGI